MKITTFAMSAALGAAMIVGCDQDATTKTADNAAQTTEDAAKALAASAEQAKDSASGEVKEAAGAAADKASELASSASEAVTKQATELYEKAMAMVKEKNFAGAEGLVSQLEALKGQLPADWASKLDSLKSAIETGKKALQALPTGGN
ncbi:MAG TPA: hypothetical protein PLD59_16250 [Tepidisphaeraceae bacterium]|nr:hypothetical protein [Tepidisphaeraceae bacterium]